MDVVNPFLLRKDICSGWTFALAARHSQRRIKVSDVSRPVASGEFLSCYLE